MRRGQVWHYSTNGSRPGPRVVVLSEDAWNDEGGWPTCALIVRHSPVPHPYRVALADSDPLGGDVIASGIQPLDPERFHGQPVGILTGSTLSRINDALRMYLEIP